MNIYMKLIFFLIFFIWVSPCYSQEQSLIINKKPNSYGWFYIIFSNKPVNVKKNSFDKNHVFITNDSVYSKIQIFENKIEISDSVKHIYGGKHHDSKENIRFNYIKFYIISPNDKCLKEEFF